ncbi:outer membrane protein assembly factor BamB family protein [Pseudomonas luteola]|uniref:outer membrane protein assembly factor BamB family protein n=1 Tax=Pseudomonas luteola TaxID=47886 RepID=UPI00163AC5DD|nr:PQQ-binding-like beta-propeller repeat protein [Pseudomonas luteola]
MSINNSSSQNQTLAPDFKKSWKGGTWSALDAKTGRILWQVPATGTNPVTSKHTSGLGPMASSPGLVYAGSMSGDMVVLDANTGAAIWKYASGGSVASAPSLINGQLFWGSGYGRFNFGRPQ